MAAAARVIAENYNRGDSSASERTSERPAFRRVTSACVRPQHGQGESTFVDSLCPSHLACVNYLSIYERRRLRIIGDADNSRKERKERWEGVKEEKKKENPRVTLYMYAKKCM